MKKKGIIILYFIAIFGTALLVFAKYFPTLEGAMIIAGAFSIFFAVNRAFESGYENGRNCLKLHNRNTDDDDDSCDITQYREEDEFDE